MKISRIQNTNFKGLLGAKTYFSPYKGIVELKKIDKYYPFQDDTFDVMEREIREILTQETDNENFETFEIPKIIDVKENLPFTRREFMSYKEKDHGKRKKLTDKDKEIESFLLYGESLGLNMYLNKYKKGLFSKKFY